MPSSPHTTGSMVVKEIFDEMDQLIAIAALLKLDGNYQQWAYYCQGPADRCGESGGEEFTPENPDYGVGQDFNLACTFCHAGLVFTEPPAGM